MCVTCVKLRDAVWSLDSLCGNGVHSALMLQTLQNKCVYLCLELDNRAHVGITEFRQINWLPVNYRFRHNDPPPPANPLSFCRGDWGLKNFQFCQKGGGTCNFWIFRGKWVKRRMQILPGVPEDFPKVIFKCDQIPHQIKNVNYCYNQNHNVFYLLTISRCLQLVNQKLFMNEKHVSFKFANKDSIFTKTSWKFPMHYIQHSIFWGILF